MTEKKTLLVIENVRIKEYDSLNVTVERFEDVLDKSKGQIIQKWKHKGYFSTIHDALKFIQRNELLINKKAITDLQSYLDQVEKSNELLLEVVKR